MSKKRIYVPVDENQLEIIKAIAKKRDRSEAYIASMLITDGIHWNNLETLAEQSFKQRNNG